MSPAPDGVDQIRFPLASTLMNVVVLGPPLLLAIWALTPSRVFWPGFVIAGWGVALLIQPIVAALPDVTHEPLPEEGEDQAARVALTPDPVGAEEIPGFAPTPEGWLRTDPAMREVHAGLKAEVRLTSFSMRYLRPVEGKVITISADRFDDPQNRESYFLARIEIPQSELKSLGNLKLTAGMPAETLIVTGHRTMLSYMVRPIRDSFGHAFHDQ